MPDPQDAAPDADDLFLDDYLARSRDAARRFAADGEARRTLRDMAALLTASLRDGGKLLVAGNGGSAADAQHIAGELTGRLMYDRAPIAAVALTTDTSALTAIANDYGVAEIFARQVRALGRPGDVFLAISTSGRSPNILRALDAARESGLRTIGFTGEDGAALRSCDLVLRAPSAWTPVIQQVHITAAHALCGLVERALHPAT